MDNIYFKCKINELVGIKKEQCDSTWPIFLEKLQKTWPTNKSIIFNKGTDNECEVEYITCSRIDANPIFKLVKGNTSYVTSGVSGYINNLLFESKDIVIIDTL